MPHVAPLLPVSHLHVSAQGIGRNGGTITLNALTQDMVQAMSEADRSSLFSRKLLLAFPFTFLILPISIVISIKYATDLLAQVCLPLPSYVESVLTATCDSRDVPDGSGVCDADVRFDTRSIVRASLPRDLP